VIIKSRQEIIETYLYILNNKDNVISYSTQICIYKKKRIQDNKKNKS